MTTSGEQLVQNITAVTAYNPIAAALARMTRPVIRLLVAGQPVTVEEIACTSGRSAEEVERTLRALPDVEWDDAGRVVALGLTTRPTDHVMEFDGRAMYAWCAAGSLIFAVLLERPSSTGPTTAGPVRPSASSSALPGRLPPWHPPPR